MIRQLALAAGIGFTFWVASIGGAALVAHYGDPDPDRPASLAFFGAGLAAIGLWNLLVLRAAWKQREPWSLRAATGLAVAAVVVPLVSALDSGAVGGLAVVETLLVIGLPALGNRWAVQRLVREVAAEDGSG